MNKPEKAIDGLEGIMRKRFGRKTSQAESILNFIKSQSEAERPALFTHLIEYSRLIREDGEMVLKTSIDERTWKKLTDNLRVEIEIFKHQISSSNDEPETVGSKLEAKMDSLGKKEKIVFLAHILNDDDTFVPYRKIPDTKIMPGAEFTTRARKLERAFMDMMAVFQYIDKGKITDKDIAGSMVNSIIESLPDKMDRVVVTGNLLNYQINKKDDASDLSGLLFLKGLLGDLEKKPGRHAFMDIVLGDLLGGLSGLGEKPGEEAEHKCATCDEVDDCPLPEAKEYLKNHPGRSPGGTGMSPEEIESPEKKE